MSDVVFFKVVFTILAAIGAIVVLGIITIVVLYLLLVRRVTARVRKSLAEFEAAQGLTIDAYGTRTLDAARDGPAYDWYSYGSDNDVPPMRIHLVPTIDDFWLKAEVVDRISGWFIKKQFQLVGNFRIAELGDECIRVLLSSDKRLVAVIRQDGFGNAPYVEICFDLGDCQRGGVSNPPGDTIQLPEGAIGEHFDFDFANSNDGLAEMLASALLLANENGALEVSSEAIENFFEEAHAAEMDARIARGGLTRAEIVAKFDGDSIAADEVENIQWSWQEAIEDFLLTQSVKAEQLDQDQEVIAVYDGSLSSFLLDRVRQFYEEFGEVKADQLQSIVSELEVMLQKFSPREAMARFRPLLPESLRYDLIDQVRKPVEADLYLLPQSE